MDAKSKVTIEGEAIMNDLELQKLIIAARPETNQVPSEFTDKVMHALSCLLYTSPSPRDAHESRMPSSA